nr:hypothetical protein [Tanacetum cinerariifolium]
MTVTYEELGYFKSVEDVPVEEPAYNKEEENLQHALELSLKEQTERTQGPSRPMAIRKPDSGRIQTLLDVQGKGKKKRRTHMLTKASGHASLDAELPMIDSETESDNVVSKIDTGDQDEGQAGPNPGDHDEGRDGPNPGEQDEGQARLNPGDAAESQPQSSHVVHVGPNRKHENHKLPCEDSVILEEPEEELGKTNAEAEVQSMVLVPIHQETSLVSPMTTPVIYLTTSQSGSLLLTSTATTSVVMTTTTILPPPPQPQQSTTDPTLVKRIDELEQHMANLLQYNLAMEEMKLSNNGCLKINPMRLIKITRSCASGASGTSRTSRSSQLPPPPLPLSTGTSRFFSNEMEECHKMLTDQVDWINPEGDQVRIDVNRPLPLGGSLGHVTIQTQFLFNKYLEYLRYGSKGSSLALSISKMKASSYPDFGLELFVPEQMWIDDKSDPPCGFSVSFELKPTPDMGYEFKHDYTIIESPRVVVFSVNNNERKIMRFNEIYKFSDGTLTWILEALAYKVKEFKLKRLNPGMNTLLQRTE